MRSPGRSSSNCASSALDSELRTLANIRTLPLAGCDSAIFFPWNGDFTKSPRRPVYRCRGSRSRLDIGRGASPAAAKHFQRLQSSENNSPDPLGQGLDAYLIERPSAGDNFNRRFAEAESVRGRSPPRFDPGRTATSPNAHGGGAPFTFSANVSIRPGFAPKP
jgi:hypothetical protein